MAATLASEGMVYALGRVDGSASLGLFQTNLTPVATSEYSDFDDAPDQATFTGYAKDGITFGNVWWDTPKAKSPATAANFTATGAVTSNTIYGYYSMMSNVVDPAVFAGRLSASVLIDQTCDKIVVILTLTLEDGG